MRRNNTADLYQLKYPHHLPTQALIWVIKPGDCLVIDKQPLTVERIYHPLVPGELPRVQVQ